ncbi:hypothetical protein L0V05_15780 [Tabrizicola sp. J26]|uniref:hypothetical protein n=1 Tax=Alitabrizicola rongguiensis TaxID=2909234 RepID=UPI001F16F909|nr:hypothetical protein [Tabrizicola rongguiensis]MCF1710273.1 hypothetical protein [Tabrizicola rongguiensis]
MATKPKKPNTAPAPQKGVDIDTALKRVTAGRKERENERIKEVARKFSDRADGPEMRLKINGTALEVAYAHDDAEAAAVLLMADMGTSDPHFFKGASSQIALIGSYGKQIDAEASNFVMSVVRGIAPKDELESMLAMQMGAIHAATMTLARRLNNVTSIPQQDAAERALNKLARTFAMQMDTLKRYRTGGQQKVTVEHVTVNEGGQAIVGNLVHGGRGNDGN